MQKLVDSDAAAGQAAIGPTANDIVAKSRKGWTDAGGELISLPADEQAEVMKTFAAGAAEVAKAKPTIEAAYKIVVDAAARTR